MNLKDQFYQQPPSAGKKYETTYVIHVQKGGAEIIPSCLIMPYRLKISIKGWDKTCPVPFFIPSRFSYKQPLNIRMRIIYNVNYGHAIPLKFGDKLSTSLPNVWLEVKASISSIVNENLLLKCHIFSAFVAVCCICITNKHHL